MSELDKRLRALFDYTGESFYWEGTLGPDDCEEWRVGFVQTIKQTFKDAGWFSLGESDTGRRLVNTVKQQENLMTGQEWYARFKDQMIELFGTGEEIDESEYFSDDTVIQAAKKAAGIE